MKYSLVQFKDGKRSIKYLVLTKDIDGFAPASAEDIPQKEYLVKWQESFDDLKGIHHNGKFPAKILLVGATPEEIKAKAKELKIRMPSKWPLPESGESDAVKKPMLKPLRKERRKPDEVSLQESVKKKRMEETSALTDSLLHSADNSQSNKKISQEGPLRRTSKVRKDEVRFSSKVESSCSTTRIHKDEVRSSSKKDSISGKISKNASLSDKSSFPFKDSSKCSPLRSISMSNRKSGQVKAAVTSKDPESFPASEDSTFNDGPGLFSDGLSKRFSSLSSPKTPSKSGQVDAVLTSKDIKSSTASPEHSTRFGPFSKHSSKHGSSFFSLKTPSKPGERSDNESDDATIGTPPIRDEDPHSDLKQTRSTTEYGKYREDSCSDDGGDFSADSSDDDDPSVLLFNLRREHNLCSIKITKLEEKVSTLKQNLRKAKKDVETKERIILDLEKDKAALQISLKSSASEKPSPINNIFGMRSSPSTSFHGGSSPPTSSFRSPSSQGKAGSEAGLVDPSSVAKKLFVDKEESDLETIKDLKKECGINLLSDTGEYPDTLEGVTKRIADDLSGKRQLSGDDKKVYVGMGLHINRKTWEKCVRVKREDSKFLKEFASLIWGREKLKVRTGNRAASGKQPCTPKKVKLLHAILKGKMHARGESEKQQDFILANLAPKWLTDKCYDSGRVTKPKS